ncbi:helix-turn-helix transcriptional regulator [Acidovorax sp. SRB_14]|uniref:helix-turn-helix transcriptional regulator n=1 Tax=Acidovorax sp. SRB_14 TaxID=1962699 RepID=UPI0020B174E5|nr:helix-turn-helix transcriptional regulator [Acidovorax sp. SRB_14]
MNHLTRHDYASALQLLARIEAQAGDAEGFARAVVLALHDYIAAERTTLSVCDRATGRCEAVGLPGGCLGADGLASSDAPFWGQRRAPRHGVEGAVAPGMCAGVGPFALQRGPLPGSGAGEYAIAVPLFRSPQTRVSVELQRHGQGFDGRDRERLALLRPHLAFLYRHACQRGAALPGTAPPAPGPGARAPEPCSVGGLTLREGQVMQWLACGKTDAEIAALLAISPRTVQKHLEHVYVKLGVETRTAAVMRAHASPSSA